MTGFYMKCKTGLKWVNLGLPIGQNNQNNEDIISILSSQSVIVSWSVDNYLLSEIRINLGYVIFLK